jgi:hypothetical protein
MPERTSKYVGGCQSSTEYRRLYACSEYHIDTETVDCGCAWKFSDKVRKGPAGEETASSSGMQKSRVTVSCLSQNVQDIRSLRRTEWSAGGRLSNAAPHMTTRPEYATIYPMANSFYQSAVCLAEKFIFSDEATFRWKVNRPMHAYGELKTHTLQFSISRILRN